MEFKGTKFNWSVNTEINQNEFGSYFLTIDAYGDNEISIASVFGDEVNDEKMNANALLISKAPEMLEMLNNVLMHDPCHYSELWDKLIKDVEKVIKEATEI